MKAYWLKFTDGSEACCEGESAFDAQRIAEKLTGKTVADKPNTWTSGNVKELPYPANPVIWQLDHPEYGKTPTFCHEPKKCCGRTSCPQSYSCTE
jgi:hypothetical protein